MAKPTYYPEWATTDTTLPVAGTSNKSRPKESLRTIGWDKSQIPAAEELNWQLDNVYDWVVYLDTINTTNKTFTLTGDVTGSTTYSNEGGFTVITTVADNSHSHVSDNITDATAEATVNTVAKRDSTGSTKFNRICATGGDSANPSFYFSENSNDTGFYLQSDGHIGVSSDGIPLGYFGDNGIHMPTYGSHTGNSSTVSSISGNISILTGILANGATIPLPSGYTESQCKWFVSVNSIGVQNDGTLDTLICYADASRVVHIEMQGPSPGTLYGNVNYMIIGIK